MKDCLSCWKLLILFQNIWVTNSRSVTMFEQCWNLMRGISSTSYNFVSNRSGPASHLYPFVAFRYRFGQLTSTFVGSFVSDSSRFVSRMAPKIPSVVVVWVCLLSANPLFTKGVMLCTIWQEITMQCFDDTLMPTQPMFFVETQRVQNRTFNSSSTSWMMGGRAMFPERIWWLYKLLMLPICRRTTYRWAGISRVFRSQGQESARNFWRGETK